MWRFVSSHQRDDGSFPLVLRSGEQGYPQTVDTSDLRWLGWYSYNNYFDYLPFLGVCLARVGDSAGANSPGDTPVPAGDAGQKLVVDKYYAVIREPGWQAVVAAPGGPRSQDQPVPYMCIGGRSVLPCFGGEEYGSCSYDLSMLPLPYVIRGDREPVYLRDVMRWSLSPGGPSRTLFLRGTCGWARFERRYTWGASEFRMVDTLRLAAHAGALAEAVPLVCVAFQMHRQSDGSYAIDPKVSNIRMHLGGIEGRIEIASGVSPAGLTQVGHERVAPKHGTERQYRRMMELSWSC